MTAPILNLYLDLWLCITPYLRFKDTLNLLRVGNPQITRLLCQSTQRACWYQSGPFLDLDAFIRICGAGGLFSSLQEIRIEPIELKIATRKPVAPLSFPSTLTFLSLHCADVITLVKPLKIATELPHLTGLSLSGEERSSVFNLWDLKFPPKLTSLSINVTPDAKLTIEADGVLSLPRNLSSLTLRGSWIQDSVLWPGKYPFDWPPSLAHLRLICCKGVPLESLPRTLTSLDLSDALPSTKFPRPDRLRGVFPWRQFFPRIHTIAIGEFYESLYMDWNRLIGSLVLDNVLDVPTVEAFMTSLFPEATSLLSSEPVETRSLEPYPCFKEIRMRPRAMLSASEPFLAEELESLSSLLANADFVHATGFLSTMSRLRATSRIKIRNDAWWDTFEGGLSPAVHTLDVEKSHVLALPPQLTRLTCKDLTGSGPKGGFLPSDYFPKKMSRLTVRDGPPGNRLFERLPATITRLNCPLRTSEDWNKIAKGLINLKQLKVVLVSTWGVPSAPLAPVASSVLQKFTLALHASWKYPPQPTVPEFFVPSLLPPSLEAMVLRREESWHASIFAVIPPTVTSLDIDFVTWENTLYEILKPYPKASDMRAEDLFESLPPKLTSLTFKGFGGSRRNARILRALPRSITHLNIDRSLETSKIMSDEWKSILPPWVCNVTIEGYTKPEFFSARPPGFLN